MEFDSNLRVKRDESTGIFYIEGPNKRTAGRPRSGAQPPVIVINGDTARAPMKAGYSHEILLSNPLVKMLSILRTLMNQYNTLNVCLQFRSDGLHIVEETDKKGTSSGYFSIFFDARYVHYYYCEKPIAVSISRMKLQQILQAVRTETHYTLIRLRETDNQVQDSAPLMFFEMYVHLNSESLSANQRTGFEVPIVASAEVRYMPKPSQYYALEFKIENNGFKNFMKGPDNDIMFTKSASTNVQIYRVNNPESIINIDDASDIVYNRMDDNQVLSLRMPVVLAQSFTQQGDAANSLFIALHPTDPIVLSYYINNTQIKTQFKVNPKDQHIGVVMRLYVLPR